MWTTQSAGYLPAMPFQGGNVPQQYVPDVQMDAGMIIQRESRIYRTTVGFISEHSQDWFTFFPRPSEALYPLCV